jgi:hypothetical protein
MVFDLGHILNSSSEPGSTLGPSLSCSDSLRLHTGFCLFGWVGFFETGSCDVAQAGLNSQSSYLSLLNAGITGVSHHVWLSHSYF